MTMIHQLMLCSFGEWVKTKTASCSETGEKERKCECGEKEIEIIEKLSHSYGAWVTTKEASCTAKGEKVRACECGAKEEKNIENAIVSGDKIVYSYIVQPASLFAM